MTGAWHASRYIKIKMNENLLCLHKLIWYYDFKMVHRFGELLIIQFKIYYFERGGMR